MRILIIEDDETCNKLLKVLLETEGYDVLTAFDGIEAFRIIESTSAIGLIIADVMMPKVDGLTLMSMIKTHKEYRHIPVIVYSSCCTQEADSRLAFVLGANAYVMKSGYSQEILEAVRSVGGTNLLKTVRDNDS